MKSKYLRITPVTLPIILFGSTILLGTLLLHSGGALTAAPISWLDALFTSTSAICVTGLTVLDTGKDFTMFGKVVILTLIQIGGLGIMTFSVLFLLFLNQYVKNAIFFTVDHFGSFGL